MGSTTLFKAVFINPEQVVRFYACTGEGLLHACISSSEMRKSSAIMCRFGLVWTFDLLADVIKFRGWTVD